MNQASKRGGIVVEADILQELAEYHFGPCTIQPLDGTHARLVVSQRHGHVYLKVCHPDVMAREIVARRIVTKGICYVPAILASGQIGDKAYAFIEPALGSPAGPKELKQLARQLGAALQRLHRVNGTGCGYLIDNGSGILASGDSPTWISPVEEWRAAITGWPLCLRTSSTCQKWEDVISVASNLVQPASQLLHGDAHLRHVSQAPKGISIIDWGEARIGDPHRDLTRFSHCGAVLYGELLVGYGFPSTEMPLLEAKRHLYTALTTAQVIRWAYSANMPVYRHELHRISRSIDVLASLVATSS